MRGRDKRACALESLLPDHGQGRLPGAGSAQMQFLLPVALSPLQADPVFDQLRAFGSPADPTVPCRPFLKLAFGSASP